MAVTLTGDGEQTLTYFSMPISKVEETADGDLVVYGKATDGSVDADEQIVDSDWSARALKSWLDSYANIRLQHNPMRPVGKGMAVETSDDGHWVKSLIVESEAKNLVKKGVLSAYSVGIARPQIVRDIKARGGRINGGELVELSLVDRPANKNCGFTLVKADSTGTPTWVGKVWGPDDTIQKVGREPSTVSVNLPSDVSVSFSPADLAKVLAQRQAELAEKRKFDQNVGGGVDRDKLSDSDFAGRNRSFPIVTPGDVSDALQSIGRAGEGNYDAATLRSRIHAIARRKGFSVPDGASKPKKKTKKATKGMDYDSNVMSHLEDVQNALDEAKHDQAMDMGLDDDETGAHADEHDEQKMAFKGDGKPSLHANDHDDDDNDSDADEDNGSSQPDNAMGKGFFPAEGTFSPDVMTALRYKSIGVPSEIGMIHDYTCPAFDPDDVAKSHPHGGLNTIDEGLWQRQAIDMASSGSLEKAKLLSTMWTYARTLKTADAGESTILRYQMHKAFQDANPGPGHAPVPSGQIHPGSYNRPFVSDGHAAVSSGQAGPNSAKVPTDNASANDYTRGPITAGHAAEGPGYSHERVGVSGPSETGRLQSANFGSIPRSNLMQAMGAMHDHISQSFPDLCPLKPESSFPAHSNPVPTPGSTPSATAAKADDVKDNDGDDDDNDTDSGKPWLKDTKKKGDLKPDGKPKKGGKLPAAAPVADMDDDASVSVAEPDVEKAVTAYLDKLLTAVPPAEQPAPATQDDIKSGVKDALSDILREEPVQPITQADVKKAVSAAVKKAMTATAEREQMQEAVASVPDIRSDVKAALDDIMREQPVTQADIKTAVQEAIDASRPKPEPATSDDIKTAMQEAVAAASQPKPEPPAAPMTAADIKKAVSAALKKAAPPAAPQAPAPASVDNDALAKLTEPLQEKIRRQEKKLWKQEKALRKQKMDAAFSKYQIPAPAPAPYQEPMVAAPATPEVDIDAAIAQMAAQMPQGVTREDLAQMTAQLPKGLTRDDLAAFAEPLLQRLELQEKLIRKQEKQLEKQLSQPQVNVAREVDAAISQMAAQVPQGPQGLTRDDLAVFAEPLLQRLELQEKLIRKQEKRIEKQQMQQFMERQQQSQPAAPAPDPEVTRQMIEELTSKLQSQPGVTEDAIKQITTPLLSRLEAQEKLLQDRLDRDSENSPVLAKLDAQDEAVRQISESLAAQPDEARNAIKEATSPLLSRLEAQEELLRRQERKLRKAQKQRRDDLSAASLREQLMSAAPQPMRGVTKAASLSELSVPLLERMKTQEKLIRKQQKQLEKQQSQLSSLDGIAKTVDAMAGMPDPNMAPFRGLAQNNVNKSVSARPAGASSVADVAERTQVMMLRELEDQFRSTADPAQREAAWKTIVKMRGLPEGTSPFQ